MNKFCESWTMKFDTRLSFLNIRQIFFPQKLQYVEEKIEVNILLFHPEK